MSVYLFELYLITNLCNGKLYVGQTTQGVKYRWREHVRAFKDTTWNHPLYNAMRKYGADNFKFELLSTHTSQEELDRAEIFLIKYIGAHVSTGGYNLDWGGVGGKKSDQTRQAMSDSWTTERKLARSLERRGKIAIEMTLEVRLAIGQANTGKKRTPEQIEVNRVANIGRHFTEKQIAASTSRRGAPRPDLGPLVSAAMKGVPKSASHKQALKESWTDNRHDNASIKAKEVSIHSRFIGSGAKSGQSRLGKPRGPYKKQVT